VEEELRSTLKKIKALEAQRIACKHGNLQAPMTQYDQSLTFRIPAGEQKL
jgi:hypothetical protein